MKQMEVKGPLIGWAEQWLNALPKADPCWWPLLVWYLENSRERDAAICALEYAVGWVLQTHRSHRHDWEKLIPIIAAKLNKWRDREARMRDFSLFPPDDLYWQVPSMSRFISMLMSSIGESEPYGKTTWRNAMMAINQATEARDTLTGGHLAFISESTGGPRVDGWNFRDHATVDHLNVLRGRIDLFEKWRREYTPAFTDDRRIAWRDLSGEHFDATCRIEHSPQGKAGAPMEFNLYVAPIPEDLSRAGRQTLSTIEIHYRLDGFTSEETKDHPQFGGVSKFDGFGGFHLTLVPRPGSNRLWLWLERPDGNKFTAMAKKKAFYTLGV